MRAGWEQVLASLAGGSRVAWTAFHEAVPLSVANGTLAVAVAGAGNLRAIAQRGHDERLRQALIDVLDMDLQIDVVHDPGAVHTSPGGHREAPAAGTSPSATTGAGGASASTPPSAADVGESSGTSTGPAAEQGGGMGSAASPEARQPSPGAALVRGATAPGAREVERPDEPSEDDPDLSAVDGLALVTRTLGARTIGEIDHT